MLHSALSPPSCGRRDCYRVVSVRSCTPGRPQTTTINIPVPPWSPSVVHLANRRSRTVGRRQRRQRFRERARLCARAAAAFVLCEFLFVCVYVSVVRRRRVVSCVCVCCVSDAARNCTRQDQRRHRAGVRHKRGTLPSLCFETCF